MPKYISVSCETWLNEEKEKKSDDVELAAIFDFLRRLSGPCSYFSSSANMRIALQ